MNYNFKDHKKGDTFEGVTFEIKVNGSALDLTGASLKMELRALEKTGAIAATFTDSSSGGLTITDESNGIFKFDKQVIDITAQTYYYDIQITLASGDVKSYIEGTWNIVQDITQG